MEKSGLPGFYPSVQPKKIGRYLSDQRSIEPEP
ncbi:hypothetical protein SynWH8101_1240 [Synechococcus sp. WH 8101]|jgi:hypothetical protein|nr:hypothetical protein SynWH8101_1240 [Synechococcus sp. WH 8101]